MSRSVVTAAGFVGEAVLSSPWDGTGGAAPGPLPLEGTVPHHHQQWSRDSTPERRGHSGKQVNLRSETFHSFVTKNNTCVLQVLFADGSVSVNPEVMEGGEDHQKGQTAEPLRKCLG